jgi:hypothetical protein
MSAVISGTNGLLQSYDYQVLTTGFSYTFAAGTQVLVINPAGTLATGTITMPASPADGMTITVESTQQVTALTMSGNGGTIVGTAVQLIPNQPLSWVYRLSNTTWYPLWGGAGRASALVSGTSVASTSGTSIDFTSIPSWVKRITVMFSGVNTNGSSGVRVQLGTSAGATTTGYLVYFVQTGASTASATSTAGFDIYPNVVTNALRSGTFVFTNISGNTWVGAVNTAFVYAGGYYSSTAGGSIALANVLDRVRITTVNGTDTFNAGSINILFE